MLRQSANTLRLDSKDQINHVSIDSNLIIDWGTLSVETLFVNQLAEVHTFLRGFRDSSEFIPRHNGACPERSTVYTQHFWLRNAV
jgi:hypothetical protein